VEILLVILRLLIALTIYAFLALILYYQRRDLRSISRLTEDAPVAQLLRVINASETEPHPLRLVNLIGRAADNTIAIDDKTLSAHHCRLSHHGGQWWLEDLGSRNGTMVNELVVDEPLVVTYGDSITMGRVEFQLEVGGPSAAPEQDDSMVSSPDNQEAV
jgi:predicted component of type VI protein secretion system